jgi:carbamoyltransferase
MYILGLNVFSHDTSAALFHKKELLIAVEEERFSKAKHTKNFPINSIKKCLEFAKINVSEVDKICIGWDINKILLERFLSQSSKESNLVKIFKERKEELDRIIDIKKQLGWRYRFFIVFFEHGKWKKLIQKPSYAFGMYALRFMVGMTFIFRKLIDGK